MALTVNTNVSSINAQRSLNSSQNSLATSMARLSSGLRVNGAKDDAAGLAIAERMNSQVKAMNVAMRNANDGISLAQTADSALGKITDSLQRMRELATQSATGTYTDSDRINMTAEYSELAKEIDRVLQNTTFNGKQLIGTNTTTTATPDAAAMRFQVGANGTASGSSEYIDVQLQDMSTASAKLGTILTNGTATTATGIESQAAAAATMDDIATAIDDITTERGKFGASQNRFETAIANLQSNSENVSAARGRIMDADFATETSNMSRAQILQQASMAMVAQANQAPQQVMKLLQ